LGIVVTIVRGFVVVVVVVVMVLRVSKIEVAENFQKKKWAGARDLNVPRLWEQ
jgi:hypothetical protein